MIKNWLNILTSADSCSEVIHSFTLLDEDVHFQILTLQTKTWKNNKKLKVIEENISKQKLILSDLEFMNMHMEGALKPNDGNRDRVYKSTFKLENLESQRNALKMKIFMDCFFEDALRARAKNSKTIMEEIAAHRETLRQMENQKISD